MFDRSSAEENEEILKFLVIGRHDWSFGATSGVNESYRMWTIIWQIHKFIYIYQYFSSELTHLKTPRRNDVSDET